MFKALKNLYLHGMLGNAGIAAAVARGFITAAEFGSITGETYEDDSLS